MWRSGRPSRHLPVRQNGAQSPSRCFSSTSNFCRPSWRSEQRFTEDTRGCCGRLDQDRVTRTWPPGRLGLGHPGCPFSTDPFEQPARRASVAESRPRAGEKRENVFSSCLVNLLFLHLAKLSLSLLQDSASVRPDHWQAVARGKPADVGQGTKGTNIHGNFKLGIVSLTT